MRCAILILSLIFITGCNIIESSSDPNIEIVSDTLTVSAVSVGGGRYDKDPDSLYVSIYGVFGFEPSDYDSLNVDVLGKDKYKVGSFSDRSFTTPIHNTRPYEIVKDDSIYFYCEANKRK